MKNVYIHIPFCKQKCNYCSFVSYPMLEYKDSYINALISEINSRYKGELLDTLYFGGGTPSVLTPDEMKRITDLFNTNKNTEITAEFNPEYKITKDYPINRISIGCQTFNNDILKYIGRKHNAQDVENAVISAKHSGISNISLDFIYGLPTQTIDMFADDLKHAISFDIQHISLYGLKLDENCYFAKHPPSHLPDNDLQADMYLKAVEIMKNAGYEHYEVSNFSKPKFNSRHNLNYWDNGTYYGFGVASHGYENGVRYYNTSNLKEYIKNPTIHKNIHKLTKQEQLEEEIFLGFRKASGIDINLINQNFGIDFETKYKPVLKKYNDYFERTKSGYKLTLDGVLVSNTILAEFLD